MRPLRGLLVDTPLHATSHIGRGTVAYTAMSIGEPVLTELNTVEKSHQEMTARILLSLGNS